MDRIRWGCYGFIVTFVRTRRALFVVMVAAVGAEAAVACSSSDRPATGSGSASTSSGGTSGTIADSSTDHDAEGGAFDASTDSPTFTDDGSCLNDEPAPKLDAGSAPPTCPSTGGCATYCSDVVAKYKLGVAQVAAKCILALGDCAELSDVGDCVDTAVDMSCKDTTSPAYCMPLVTSCDPNAGKMGSLIDEPGCEMIANGLSASGRSTFSACIESKIEMGTCPNDVHLCTDQLRQ